MVANRHCFLTENCSFTVFEHYQLLIHSAEHFDGADYFLWSFNAQC